jgi:putative ABC transport system permease protein
VYRRTFVERLAVVRLLSPEARITLRHILRNPVQSILTAVGISLSVAIMVAGMFWIDAIEYVMEVQFTQAQRDDAFVSFYTPLNTRALTELAHMPGVLAVEGLRSVPVRLRNGLRSYLTGLQGLPEHSRFRRPLDQDLRPLAMPLEGVLISQSLSRVLQVVPGDLLVVDVLEGKRPTRVLRVAALANDFIGVSAYMDKAVLNRWMEEGPLNSGAALAVDPGQSAELYAQLKRLPRVAAVGARSTIIQLFRDLTGRNIVVTSVILALFSSVIAVGVVYNSARIALSERAWELASLRVLGFTKGEVSRILLGKLAVELLAALPIGFGLGYLLCLWMLEAFVYTETITLPLYITSRVYGFAALVALGAGLFSALLVHRQIKHLDLVGVLKSRD